MTEDELLEKKRAARAKKKRIRLLKRVTALSVIFLLVALLVFGAAKLIAAISAARDKIEITEQIGPSLPTSADTIAPLKNLYNYSAKVPLDNSAVADFSRSLMIGDSRVAVYSVYGGLLPAGMTCAYNENVSVSSAATAEFTLTGSGASTTISELLSGGSYDRIYLEFGLNELGWEYSNLFAEAYSSLLAELRRLAPSSDVYVGGIIPVSATLGSEIITNEKISSYNALILSAAADAEVYYLELGEAFEEAGALNPAYNAGNGIGLSRAGGVAWLEYLKTHIVNKENYQ